MHVYSGPRLIRPQNTRKNLAQLDGGPKKGAHLTWAGKENQAELSRVPNYPGTELSGANCIRTHMDTLTLWSNHNQPCAVSHHYSSIYHTHILIIVLYNMTITIYVLKSNCSRISIYLLRNL